MDAATAALVGAALGFVGNALVTWINKHFDERKARRELIIKSAWDYYTTRLEITKALGGSFPPFETFLFYTTKVIDLALRKNLSNQEVLEQLRKIHEFEEQLVQVARDYSTKECWVPKATKGTFMTTAPAGSGVCP
jgi:hypothetical protein